MSKSNLRLVYLLAASHSGTTLLALLLGAHPDVCTVGELKATSFGDPDHYRCSCLQLIRRCPFWQEVSREMLHRGIDFEVASAGTDIRTGATPYVKKLLSPLHRGPLLEAVRDAALALSPVWRQTVREIQARNYALLESVAAVTGKNIIVDSSKIGIRLKYLLRIPEIDVRVIRVVRDGRGVALTYIDPARFADASEPDLQGGGTGSNREKGRTIEEAAKEWRRSNEEAEAIVNQLKEDQWCKVHYEDVCKEPEKTLYRLFSFIGVDPDKMIVDFRSIEHHVVGNGMRLDSSSAIKLDDRWRRELSAADLEIFANVAGTLNGRLGYK